MRDSKEIHARRRLARIEGASPRNFRARARVFRSPQSTEKPTGSRHLRTPVKNSTATLKDGPKMTCAGTKQPYISFLRFSALDKPSQTPVKNKPDFLITTSNKWKREIVKEWPVIFLMNELYFDHRIYLRLGRSIIYLLKVRGICSLLMDSLTLQY